MKRVITFFIGLFVIFANCAEAADTNLNNINNAYDKNLSMKPKKILKTNENYYWQSITVDNNDKFVAVGINGAIVTSSDGNSWVSESSGVTYDLYGVSANKTGKFVAVGEHGTILTSFDGKKWVLKSSGTVNCLNFVVTNNNDKWVVVGGEFFDDNGEILSSYDGDNWKKVESINYKLNGVAVNSNGKFVAVGENINGQGVILTSSDGDNWKTLESVNYQLKGITVDSNGKFVAVGAGVILTSFDGDNWSKTFESGSDTFFVGITVTNKGEFVAIDWWGNVAISQDGYNWILQPTGYVYLNGIAVNSNGKFEAVGPKIYKSDNNAQNWECSQC